MNSFKYFVFSVVGLMVLFLASPYIDYVKNEIRKEVRIKILKKSFSDAEIVKFKLVDLQNAKWENTDEFILNNELYDVVEFKIVDGFDYVFCIKDQKETLIQPIKNIANILFKKKDRNFCFSKEKYRTPSHFKTLFQQEKSSLISIEFFAFNSEIYSSEKTHYFKYFNQVFSPPQNYC